MKNDLPEGITEEILQDVMKHTKESREGAIKILKAQSLSKKFDARELNMEKINDPNYLLSQLPKILGNLNGVLNPVKFKLVISNLDSQKLADLASLGEKWVQAENEQRDN